MPTTIRIELIYESSLIDSCGMSHATLYRTAVITHPINITSRNNFHMITSRNHNLVPYFPTTLLQWQFHHTKPSIQLSISKTPPLHPTASQLPPRTYHRAFNTNRPRRIKHEGDSAQQNTPFHPNGPIYSKQRRTRLRHPRIRGLPQNPTFLLHDTPSWEGNLLSMQTSKGRRRCPSLLPF